MQIPKLAASPALVEMLDRERALGIDPFAIPPSEPMPAPQPPATFSIPPPDWDQEAREREEQERQRQQEERRQIIEEELARIEDEQTYPAAPAQKRRRVRGLLSPGQETP